MSLNSNSPVLNFGIDDCPANLYSGILKLNLVVPAPFVIKGLPSTGVASLVNSVVDGVTKLVISLPSKNAYNLIPGLKHSPVTVSVLGLTKGINALAITLLPNDSSSIFSTTDVCKPVLVKSVLVVCVTLCFCDAILPPLPKPLSVEKSVNVSPNCVSTTPDHCSCHAFHTVPNTP